MATVDVGRLLANAKKRRGVARASLSRLSNRIKELERKEPGPKTLDLAQRTSQKLTDLDTEFRTHHHALIDMIDDEDTLAREQETLDVHDDLIAELAVRVKQIVTTSSPSPSDSSHRVVAKKLAHLQRSLASVLSVTSAESAVIPDTCLLRQYEEKTSDIRRDLART